ncbi:MAG TPA: hypothetical protein VGN17_03940 [Bryobacteraceae bacterium]|jgi:hypothetical protein
MDWQDHLAEDELVDGRPEFTRRDLKTINHAIAAGVLEVRYSDRTVRYNSTSDLLKARQTIQTYLDSQNGTARIRQALLYS